MRKTGPVTTGDLRRNGTAGSPDGAKRNPGFTHTGDEDPKFAALHPGYVC